MRHVFRCAINDDVVFITAEVVDTDVVMEHISFCVTGVTKLSNVWLLCFPTDGASRWVIWMPIYQQKQIFMQRMYVSETLNGCENNDTSIVSQLRKND